ncbi:hypothetical protein WAF17_10180 [Bernardetia sp. ABR2-2B]|uniref:hypothetical protein n=1 Tax=Bernardetia sp. ABR2-2B TaxID=3127472 RepID=UPI0030CEEB2D
MKKINKFIVLITSLLVCLITKSYSQDISKGYCESYIVSRENNKKLDSLITNKKLLIIGEVHSMPENSLYYLLIIDRLISLGYKKATLYIEMTPIFAWFLNDLINNSNNQNYKDYRLNKEDYALVEGLIVRKNKIKVNIIGVDVDANVLRKQNNRLINQLLRKVPDSVTFEHLKKLRDAKKTKILYSLTEEVYKDSTLLSFYKNVMEEIDFIYFKDQIIAMNEVGRVKFSKPTDKIDMRDKWMASRINFTLDTSQIHIYPVGLYHIIPRNKEKNCELVKNISKIDRKDIVIVPIMYRGLSMFFYLEELIEPFNDKERKLQKMLESKIFDAIFYTP